MAKSLDLKPEHINLMIRFAKLVRRSARQNKVLWNIVDTMLEGTGYKLELYNEKDGDAIYPHQVMPRVDRSPHGDAGLRKRSSADLIFSQCEPPDQTLAAPSIASRRSFSGSPTPPPNPPRLPSARTTRWHGMSSAIRFRAIACPAARGAPGRPASAASQE